MIIENSNKIKAAPCVGLIWNKPGCMLPGSLQNSLLSTTELPQDIDLKSIYMRLLVNLKLLNSNPCSVVSRSLKRPRIYPNYTAYLKAILHPGKKIIS